MKISIGHHTISDKHPVCFVAEVGAFFNKDIGLAKEYLDLASQAGVDVFKTEILHTADVVLAGSDASFSYKTEAGLIEENYRAFIERKVVPLKHYAQLFEHGRKSGMPLMATVFDTIGVDFLVEQKAAAIKISRNNINHEPLIRYAAQSGLPIIFDMGDVPIWKAQRALCWVYNEGGNAMFNHHPVKNPASPEDHNLILIQWLKNVLKTPVGLSCHYKGDEILYAAIGAGVNLVEKGVDIDPERDEADLISAAAFSELSTIVSKCKSCSAAIGGDKLNVNEERLDNVRTGMAAKEDIYIGEELSFDKVTFAWPPIGISPDNWRVIEGKKLKKDIKKGQPIKWEDIIGD